MLIILYFVLLFLDSFIDKLTKLIK